MLHPALKDAIDREFSAVMAEPAELCRDALLVRLNNDVAIELRIAGAEEYSIAWRWGEAELRIDTAPLHRQLATFPNHLHDGEGRLRPDPLTRPGSDPWDNVRAVIAALLEAPLLETHIGRN
ncbi:MAG TPA: hypothetical protein VMV33_04595 [Rhodocyclaceae bacterium]|nr:hypothetical protein [Rhodocyclaceae bacterium]